MGLSHCHGYLCFCLPSILFIIFIYLAITCNFIPEEHSRVTFEIFFLKDGIYPYEHWVSDSIEPIRFVSQKHLS